MDPARFGKYEVLRRLASGGMADVYLCRLPGAEGFEKTVAVKAINPRLSGDVRFREMFAREARIAAALSHPNLVHVFDFGREGESLYLAMEYVPGWTLAQAVAQARLRAVPVPASVWRCWTEGILAGVGYLHRRRIVHRDISPGNVLLSRSGAVKVADFGIARVAGGGPEAPGGGGKAAYMAPEQARGAEATRASDLFAAAVVSAEIFLPGRLIAGEEPEKARLSLREFDPALLPAGAFPPGVRAALARALSPSVEARYADAESFAAAVRTAVPAAAGSAEIAAFWDRLFPESGEEATVIDAPGGGGAPVVIRESRERYRAAGRRRAALVGVAAVAAVALGGGILRKGMRTEDPRRAPSSRESSPPAAAQSVPKPSPGGTSPGSSHAPRAVEVPSRAGGPPGSGTVPGPGSPESLSSEPSAPSRGRPEGATGSGKTDSVHAVRIVTDPPGVSVTSDDGIPVGRTPLVLEPSRWSGRALRLEKDGYASRTFRAGALQGLTELRLEMERETGTLPVIQANPWARVYADGRYLGDTPLRDVVLPTGEHRLRFHNPELGVDVEERIAVRPGENAKIVIYMINK